MILVTGAAGRLGSRVVRALLEQGRSVRAVDVRPAASTTAGAEWRTADLADPAACASLFAGVTHVAHLAHQPRRDHPTTLFNDNVAMHANVFQGAAEAGAQRIVFASSIQVIAGDDARGGVPGACAPRPAAFPLDGYVAPAPGNLYGLSKQVGEEALRYFTRNHRISGVALRFPALVEDVLTRPSEPRVVRPVDIAQGFTWLSQDDAARLVIAALLSETPGFRVYQPAAPNPSCGLKLGEVIGTFYADIPRKPGSETGLVDLGALQRDFNWSPRDLELPKRMNVLQRVYRKFTGKIRGS